MDGVLVGGATGDRIDGEDRRGAHVNYDPDRGGYRQLWESRVPRQPGESYDDWQRRVKEATTPADDLPPSSNPAVNTARTERLQRQGVMNRSA